VSSSLLRGSQLWTGWSHRPDRGDHRRQCRHRPCGGAGARPGGRLNLGFVLTPDWIKTATELTAGTGESWESYIQGIADERAPIRRFASPEEIAHFFVFLCSDRSSYCVGSSYYVDGGMLKVVN